MDGWRRFSICMLAMLVAAALAGAAAGICVAAGITPGAAGGVILLGSGAAILFIRLRRQIKRLSALMQSCRMEYASAPTRADPDVAMTKLIDDISKFHADALSADFWKKEVELSAMQSQINPHFLYNTLDCIRGQALHEKSYALAKMVENLSSFFRYSISLGENLVSLCDELENVKNYFEIQKYRFGDRFTLQIDIQNESMLMRTLPKMTMQPLVENAILHGLENTGQGGWIRIRASCTQCCMRIVVEDNGTGIPPGELRRLNEMFEQSGDRQERPRRSFALNNVNRRLKLFFGEAYELHLFSTPDVGTEACITLPYKEVDADGS